MQRCEESPYFEVEIDFFYVGGGASTGASTGPPPRGLRGKAMGHCVQRALLGARDTNPLLRAAKWIMYGNAQPFNLVKQWLRALPDAMRHGHQHPTVVVPGPASKGQNGQLFNFAPKVVGAPRDVLISLRHHQSALRQLREPHTILGAKEKN